MKGFNTKKEIRDIMLQMESLSEMQIAPTLTEEKLKELMDSNGIDSTNAEVLTRSNDVINSCEDSDCKNEIDFCNKISIAKGFIVNSISNTTMQFNTSLFCFTDPCPCNVTVTPGDDCNTFCIALYPRRIIGCIQYRASTGNISGERFVGSNNGIISVEGSLCVNRIVSYQQCPPTFAEAQPKLIPDNQVNGTVNASKEKCELLSIIGETPVIKFTGTFTLPTTCPTTTCPEVACTPPVCPTICPPTPSCPPCNG